MADQGHCARGSNLRVFGAQLGPALALLAVLFVCGAPLAAASAPPMGLLGTECNNPAIIYNGAGTTRYNAQSGLFSVDAHPLFLLLDSGAGLVLPDPQAGSYHVKVAIQIANTGALVGGTAGNDLEVVGSVNIDTDGDGQAEQYEGTLLTGEILAYGYQVDRAADGTVVVAKFDFRFTNTGGALAGIFGPKIGVTLVSEINSLPGLDLFDGDFTKDSGGNAKGNICNPGGEEEIRIAKSVEKICPPAPGPCGPCDGKVNRLRLRYRGTIQQARVRVRQKKDCVVVFDDVVPPGGEFSCEGQDKKGTLGTEIEIFVNDVSNTKIHTSCSQPIGPGLVRGDFEVVSGESRNGGPLPPLGADPSTECDDDDDCDPSEILVGDTLEYTITVTANLMNPAMSSCGTAWTARWSSSPPPTAAPWCPAGASSSGTSPCPRARA